MAGTEIERVRAAIDTVDDELVAILARRFELTNVVGQLKVALGEQPMNPLRQGQRKKVIAALATKYGVEMNLLEEIFSAIQRRTLANHRQIAESAGTPTTPSPPTRLNRRPTARA